jgi:hypothetical protein
LEQYGPDWGAARRESSWHRGFWLIKLVISICCRHGIVVAGWATIVLFAPRIDKP